MSGALSRHTIANTPPTRPIPGLESEMVRNAAGGYVFDRDLWTRLADFLVLGTEGGTYYVDEQTHTFNNISVVHQALAQDGVRAVQMAVEYSTARPVRVTKNYPALYVVAAALAQSQDTEARQAAADAVPKVARTTDHLSHLFGYYKSIGGKPGRGGVGRAPTTSRVVRRAFSNWFTQNSPDRVAYQILKGRQRKTGDGEQFRPGDLLRLAHPSPRNPVEQALFGLALGNIDAMAASGYLSNAKAFYEAQRADTPAKAVRAILAYHVPWEFLPTEVLKYPEVWEALAPHLGMTALIRNLARMTQNGALGPFRPTNNEVSNRLRDVSQLHASRVHPFDLMLAALVYSSGRAHPRPQAPVRTWQPVPDVISALEDAYRLSFGVVDKAPGRLVVAVDSSGSMTHYAVRHGGSVLGSAYRVCNAMAQALVDSWGGQCWPMDFDTEYRPSKLRPGMRLGEIFRLFSNGGGTDCSIPIEWALTNRVECDAFVLLTDGETWAGRRHASQVLADYRRVINPAARVIVVSTTATPGSLFRSVEDPGVLNIAGFDAQLPTRIAGYLAAAGVV